METQVQFRIDGKRYILFIEKGMFKRKISLFECQVQGPFMRDIPIKISTSTLKEAIGYWLIKLKHDFFERKHKRNRQYGHKAEDCALQHIKTFHKQALKGEQADYGEPCIDCPHAGTCQLDWSSIMMPLMEKSRIKISLVH